MATKNITIEMDVYDRLKALKGPSESFSQVLRRSLPTQWAAVTAGELLVMNEDEGGVLKASANQLDEIELNRHEANRGQDPWSS